MSTVARKERWREARRSARHWSLIALIILSPINAVAEWFRHLPWFVDYPMLVLQGAFLLGMIMHPRELCEKCISMMPLDPEKDVKREKPMLRLHHSWKVRLTILLGSILLDVFTKAHSLVDNLNNSLFDVWMAFVLFSLLRHSRLEPWCPWCKSDGDGGGEVEEVPDPTDDHSKPIPV